MNAKRNLSRTEPDPAAAGPEAPPAIQSTDPPEEAPYGLLRAQAGQLEAALAKLEQVETDIIKVRSELSATEQKRAALLPMENVDLDVLSNLGSRVNACQARLEHLAARLLDTQKDTQARFLALGGEAGTLYQRTRQALIEQATDRIVELLHPVARTLQRQTIWHNLSHFGIAVIEFQQRCEIAIHPLASSPLEDTPAKAWSEERETTMRMVRQESLSLLGRLPPLIETMIDVGLESAAPLQVTPAAA